MPSQFDPQFEKRRKAEREKKAAEEQAAEQAALKNQAPPAPAADANAADAKTVPPASGSGKETQPAPDAKATAIAAPVTEPPAKDAAPTKDADVSAEAPETKKDEAAPAAPGKPPATSPSIKPPAPPTKGWSLTDPARRGERPLQLTQEEEKKKEDERQKLARRNEELELRKAIKNQNYFELSEFSGSKNPEAERKKMIVEMYVLFHERGKSLPGDEKEREIRRIDMAFKRFKGRGAESVDAFFEEMQKEVKAQEEAEAFDVELYTHASRSYVISKFEPERSGEFGWKQFSEAAKKHPSYNPADEGKLFPMWEAIVKDTDRRIAPFAAQAARIWEGIKQDNAASVAASVYREIAPKDRAALMDALGMLARALPKDEQATLLGNLMKQAERDIGTLLGNIASMPASGKDLYGLGDFIEYPGSEKTTGRYLRAEWETKRQELLIARNFQIDIQRIGYEIYDPMKSAFGEGPPGILESAFISIPGALASTAVALVPYAGPLAIYSTMEASSYDSMRRQLIDSGMSDEDATRYAATWAPYVALPQVGLERLQAGAILGKLPFLEKAFTKFGDKIASDVIRGALRTGAGALQETSIEITQDYLPHLLQDTAAALSEDVPDVVWRNGKDGVLDGFWAQSATTFITMLPLAVLGAAGGINADQRVKAFSNASDSTLLALGGSPEAIAALRAAQAQGHASTDAAINHLMSTLNPNSVSARQAVAQLEVEQQEGVQAELSSGEQADAANGNTPSTGDPAAATATPAIEDGMAPELGEMPSSPASPTGQEQQVSQPMVSEKVYETFTRSANDPTALVPDSEKIHRNIDIVRPQVGNRPPLDVSSNEATPFREGFDQHYRAAEGFEIRKQFIPAATEAEALAEYARRNGQDTPPAGLKATPISAWVNAQGEVTPFRDAQERDSWREDRIRSAHIIANRSNGGATESTGLTYEESVKEHPFLEIMATIPHDKASYNVADGRFSITSSQGGRAYKLDGITKDGSIHIVGLFPEGEKKAKAGPTSFGSDFLVTVLAYSRQMPGITITANAAKGGPMDMNGYAMWPKLGFEAKNPADLKRILSDKGIPSTVAARMKELADTGNGIPSLIKLNSSKEGQLLWKEHGDTIEVHFDTSPGNPGDDSLRRQVSKIFQRNQARRKKGDAGHSPELQSE